jgi:hypothetical protein
MAVGATWSAKWATTDIKNMGKIDEESIEDFAEIILKNFEGAYLIAMRRGKLAISWIGLIEFGW